MAPLNDVMVSIIAAVAENGVIGNGGTMPWRLSTDLRRFKALTLGKPVIMGRRTFESIGKPLPGRTNIVVSRRSDYRPEGVTVAASLDDALAEARSAALRAGLNEVFVIGGGEIYRAALPRADWLHITGITPALGEGPAQAVHRAVDIAADAGVTISLDVNFRSLLWNEAEARHALLPLLRRSDLVFAGPHEAALVVPGADGPEELARGICALGPAAAVIKVGADGAYALIDGKPHRQPAVAVQVHDSVGAGDAFAAGYLAELLAGEPPERRLRTAALLGAFAVSTAGDWEGLPRRSELGLLDHHDDIVR